MHKFRLNDVKSDYVKEIWANRSDEERASIAEKISSAQTAVMASRTEDERREITAKARASIDRSVQGPAASRGLKKWWKDLRKDPERYQEYIQRRKDARKAKKNANV